MAESIGIFLGGMAAADSHYQPVVWLVLGLVPPAPAL